MTSPPFQIDRGWVALRCMLALLIAVHGWARWLAGGVVPFGEWLNGQGLVFGLAIAWSITLFEIVGTLLLAAGIRVPALALIFSAIYATGVYLVHLPAGWFVVGLGRNGAEYSALLIGCLLLVARAHRAPRSGAAGA
jgi:putative oxidoreductase